MTIQLFQPATDHNEIVALTRVLDSHWLGKGKRVTEFETAWAQHVGVPAKNVVSTNSCTSALFEAVRLAGIRKGDEVIIPTIHFIGAVQAVIAAGGIPVFCDVNRWTMNATDETLESKWTKRTKAVLLNHYGGMACGIRRNDFPKETIWIDDLACAPGHRLSLYYGSNFSVWSFDAMKVITCSDGGMLYCHNPGHAEQARRDFYLGLDTESGFSSDNPERWWEFAVYSPGKGRQIMNDLAASIGLAQLEKLERFIQRRNEIARMYKQLLEGTPILKIMSGDSFVWIFMRNRDALSRHLRDRGVYTSFRYYPLNRAYKTGDQLPEAEWAADHALLLPFHNGLDDRDVDRVCDKVKEFYR